MVDQSDTSAAMVNLAETMDDFTAQRKRRQGHFDKLEKAKNHIASNDLTKSVEHDRDSEDEQLVEEVKFGKSTASPRKATKQIDTKK